MRLLISAAFVLSCQVILCVGEEQSNVRLKGSAIPGQGYVEVFYSETWGTICRDGWDFLDAFVVCRQLGFSWVSYRGWEADYGPGGGPAWLSNVTCQGSELSIDSCANDGWMKHNCTSTSAAAVSCGKIDGYAKSVGYLGGGLTYDGYAISEGNAYLKFAAQKYYALPDYNWDIRDADVFCRQRNRSAGGGIFARRATNGSYFGRHGDELSPIGGDRLPVTVLPVEFTCKGDEASLMECPAQELANGTVLNGHDAGVECVLRQGPKDFKIRLVNGSSPLEGRVEVFYNGSWGSVEYILGQSIGVEETPFADVVCRQLGQGYPTVTSKDGRFGKSSPRIKLSIVRCSGAENSLAECGPKLKWVDREGQGYNLSIVCSGPVKQDVIPARLYKSAFQYKPSSTAVQDFGTLQVYHGDRFETVCNVGWTLANSKVACRQMGYGPPSDALAPYSPNRATVGGPMDFEVISCNGDESSLDQCSRSNCLQAKCDHSDNVEIVCYFQPNQKAAVNDVLQSGHLHVFFKDSWGSICHKDWDFEDAAVVCRQTGYSFTSEPGHPEPPLRNMPMWLSGLMCHGGEESLADCLNDGWGKWPCDKIVSGVGCRNEDGYFDAQAFIADGLGDDAVASEGTALFRLSTGEVVAVCDNEWDLEDAKAFCRQIGKYSAEGSTTRAYFGQPPSQNPPLKLRYLNAVFKCQGSEKSLHECPAGLSCSFWSPAGVMCLQRPEPRNFQIRLTGGGTDNEGRVEVFYGESWGSVGSGVNLTYPLRYGDVICRQLGRGYAKEVFVHGARYGKSTLPVKMTGVWCAGSENSLAQCGPNVEWVDTQDDTLTGDDSGIVCSGSLPVSAYPLRLAPESSHEREGYLEIFKGERFGTICSHSWDDWKNQVACRQLGFGPPTEEQPKGSGVHRGAIFSANEFDCDGTESSLSECLASEPYRGSSCTHSLDVYINCTKAAKPNNSAALITFPWSTMLLMLGVYIAS